MKEEKHDLEESLIQSEADSEQPQMTKKEKKNNKYMRKLPLVNGSNLVSTLFFGWLYSFVSYGWRTTVKIDSMPKLPKEMKSENQFEAMKTQFKNTTKSKRQGFTLIKVLSKTYYNEFLPIMAFLILYVVVQSVNPYLTALIMRYISHKQDYESYYGWVMFGIIIFAQTIKSLSDAHLGYRFTKLGINMTNSLTLLIFTKSLKYQSIAQKQFTESEIVNYSQVDAQRMSSGGFELTAVLIAPLQIIVGIFMMHHFIGISFLSGIGVMLVTIFCTYLFQKRSYKFNEKILKKKDERMKVTQEMLDIIRYIKINSIEKFFYRKIDEKRSDEVVFYQKKGLMDVLTIFVYWSACPLILSLTFITYILIGNEMSSEVAFTTIMIFTTLQFPIRLLPTSISSLVQMVTSIKRIQKFLYAKEIHQDHVEQKINDDNEQAIVIERGNFFYGMEKQDPKEEEKGKKKFDKTQSKDKLLQNESNEKNIQDEPTEAALEQSESEGEREVKDGYFKVLKNINTSIKKGSFTMVLGNIGSGKSSLLMAVLNEMVADSDSRVTINGKIAYSAQKPWIMSASVKDNITFESPYDQQKFRKVIHYASLEQDMKILPHGVNTEIGEKGINISGGQKARIGLARALYSDRDIYFLDDILSAVDVHVGQFLMRETLQGYLKGKTIVMPTHAIKFAEMVDELIIMDKGRIVRKGHYRDISTTDEFMKLFLMADKKDKEQEDEQNVLEEELQRKKSVQKELEIKKSFRKIQEKPKNEDKIIERLMIPQDQQIGKVDYKIFKEYIHLNGGYIRFAFVVVLAMICWISLTIASLLIMEQWCEDPLGNSNYLYLYVGFSIGSGIFILLRAYKLVMAGARQGHIVHRRMMKALLYASLGNFFNRVPVGRIINRLTKDLRELDEVIGFKIGNVLVSSFSLLGNLVICVYGSTPFILIFIALVGFFAYRMRKYYMRTQIEVSRFQKSTNSPIVSGFLSTISGLSSIRAYKMSQQFTYKQMCNLDNNKRVRLTKAGMQSWFSINLTYMSFFINMGSIGYCLLSSNTNASLAGLLMNYAINLSSDINTTTNNITQFESKIVSLERIYSFMEIEPEGAYQQYCSNNWSPVEEGFQQVIKKGSVQFRDMSARYRDDLPDVLKGMNVSIKAGEKIGIVGRTGAGKSTIINTLLGITQVSNGALLVDGVRIEDYLVKNLRYGVTMIDQEPTLIKSTFRQNLDITNSYTDSELYEILKECNLYETIVGKGGLDGAVSNESLSAGEKQLLCICRAFLKHSKVVLVDEATANIDVKNDAIIQKVIAEKFKECTVLTIAHRLSTLAHSDKILVMENGQAVQFGSPAELQEKEDGWYRQMIMRNAKEFLI